MTIDTTFERGLIALMDRLHMETIRGVMIRRELWDDWQMLEGKICFQITQIRYMSISEASRYIDYSTGDFKPGEYMSFCTDETLQNLFARLRQVVRLQTELYRSSANRILSQTKELQEKVAQGIGTMRSVLGTDAANRRLKQLLDAYPHLRNTICVKGVSDFDFDFRKCYLDAKSGHWVLDTYNLGRQKRLCGMYDDILVEYTKLRVKKEGVSEFLIKSKASFVIERDGKLIQGWGGEKLTDRLSYGGEYINGKQNGYGQFVCEDQYRYRGSVVEGRKEGYGICLYDNGDCYEGWWQADARHGKGSLCKRDGSVVEGYWKNGTFVGQTCAEEPLRVPPRQSAAPAKPAPVAKPAPTAPFAMPALQKGASVADASSVARPTQTEKPVSTPASPLPKPAVAVSKPSVGLEKTQLADTVKVYEVVNGCPSGFGLTRFSDGRNDCGEVSGRFATKNGMGIREESAKKPFLYAGFFQDGKRDGYGLKIEYNGTAYFGEWKKGELVRQIREYASLNGFLMQEVGFAPKEVELREFVSGGDRTVCTSSAEGKCHGYGMCYYGGEHAGKKYLGQFKDGYPNGLGVVVYPDGQMYIGGYLVNGRHGEGMLVKGDECTCGKWEFDRPVNKA